METPKTKVLTVQRAKEFLRANFSSGVNCPCCGQYVKLYKRKLNSGMAVTLLRIYKYHKRNQVNVKEFLKEMKFSNNHDWTLLKYWSFIKEAKNIETNKKSSGVWEITLTGEQFIKGFIPAPEHILIFDKKFQGYSNTSTDIEKSLGNKFDYQELMKS